MKHFNLLQLITAFFLGIILVGCSSNDDDPTPIEEASLELSLGGANYTANFDGANAAIIAVTNPNINWTSVTLGGTTTSGEVISFVIAFDGKTAGNSTVTGAAGENTSDPTGLSLSIVSSGTTGVVYEAININVNITSYTPVSGVTAVVKGIFSGAVQDVDGNQFNVSGTFNTGPLS